MSTPATKHAVFDAAFGDDDAAARTLPPGAYEFRTDHRGQRWMWFKCPGRCATVTTIAIRPTVQDVAEHPSWAWDGNEDAPTLRPSLDHRQCWHGWLTAGVFTEC